MAIYQIRVKGHLKGHWSEWFDGLVISNLKNGEAVLCGEIVDQAALHGVLIKVRDARTFARAVPPGDEPAGSIRGRGILRTSPVSGSRKFAPDFGKCDHAFVVESD
jgi:hypothetical protein